ncbi:hypothetical protein N7507_005033 [Penicillium longicatenatum]|nr:hypothetical protein N7507_005033 [Penicillium longicatenatum]
MGLSKVFPCLRKKEAQKQTQASNNTTGNTSTASNTGSDPPKLPPIDDIAGGSDTQTRKPPGDAEAPKEKDDAPAKAEDASTENISQHVWDRAFDELADADDTKGLVEAYLKVIPEATKPDDAPKDTKSGNEEAAAAMKDPARRRELLEKFVRAGKEKFFESKSTKASNFAGKASNFILKLKEPIDTAVSTNPQAALPWAGVCIGLQFLTNPAQATESNRDGIAYVSTRMEWYCSLSEHLLSRKFINEEELDSFDKVVDKLEDRVVALYKALLSFQMKSVCTYYQNQGWTFLKGLLNLNGWDEMKTGIQDAESAVENDSAFYIKLEDRQNLNKMVESGRKIHQSLGDINQTLKGYIEMRMRKEEDGDYEKCMADLRRVDPLEQMNTIEGKKDDLVHEAFEWVLDTDEYRALTDWSDQSSCRVVCLNGPAGAGKTMLTIGIINELWNQSCLAPGISFFFCRADDEENNGANHALRSLIWLLLKQQPDLWSHLKHAHKISQEKMFENDDTFFSLVKIFQAMLADERLTPVYLVLDALDECAEGRPGVTDLIFKLISDSINEKTAGKVKWLVSSRPELQVFEKLNRAHPAAVLELDVQSHPEPVNAYIDYKLTELEDKYMYRHEYVEPLDVLIREKAQNTFLWVALVFKELTDDEDPVKDWQAVGTVKETPEDLEGLYEKWMARIDKLRQRMFCIALLGASCFARRPLSYQEIHTLAGLPQIPTQDIIQSCGSFLAVHKKTVYPIHNSSNEWLIKYFKSGRADGGIEQIHLNMATLSIDAMKKDLRFNIYDIQPGTEIADIRPPEIDPLAAVRYSCEYWVDHLCKTQVTLSDNAPAFDFLKAHFLHWLESLSLLNKLTSASSSIKKLLAKAESTSNENSKLLAFLNDAERFMARNLAIMTEAPLQIYGSALLFSPRKSIIKSLFWGERSSYITSIAGLASGWDSCLQSLNPGGTAKQVMFSPDGKYFASASSTLQLWDTAIGVSILQFDTDNEYPHCLAFSPDGETLVAGFQEKIRIYDVASKGCKNTFDVPECDIRALGFSSDGKSLAFTSDFAFKSWNSSDRQHQIKVLDALKWTEIYTLGGHTNRISGLAVAPNKPFLLTSDIDWVTKLWDLRDKSCKRIIRSRFYTAFSPDGNMIVTIGDSEVCLLDAESGEEIKRIPTRGIALSVAFSPDSKTLAFGDPRGKIILVDVETSAITQTYSQGGSIRCMEFHKDNNILISSSEPESGAIAFEDGNIRIWELNSHSEGPSVSHKEKVAMLEFSKDGTTLVSGSDDKTFMLWDLSSKSLRYTLEGHTSQPYAIAYAPNGDTVATMDRKRSTVRLWDTQSGVCRHTLELVSSSHEQTTRPRASTAKFSPDGTLIAVTMNNTLSTGIWDVATGTKTKTLPVHVHGDDFIREFSSSGDGFIRQLSFSEDGKTLAIGVYSAEIWDVDSGTLRWSDTIPRIRRIALSPDGKSLASLYPEGAVEIHDVDSGEKRQTLDMRLDDLVDDLDDLHDSNFFLTDDGKHLVINQSFFPFTDGFLQETADPKLSQSIIYFDESWVVRGGKKLLWVPGDYKHSISVYHERTLALGAFDGRVVFIEFADY